MKISYYLPDIILGNKDFEQYGWPADKILEKTGISRRHIAKENEFALDLAVSACEKLFNEYAIRRDSIDYVLYCTQSPDFIVPNNASILQNRLKLNTNLGSLDLNQGCTGFVYALSMAKGLLLSDQANNVLIVTADTWSKYLNEQDKSTRSIFGDGAAATFLTREDALKIGKFVFGTDGSGADNLIIKTSGLRYRRGSFPSKTTTDKSGNTRTDDDLYMNGPDIFNFTIDQVPKLIHRLLHDASFTMEDIDHFVFHQANGYILEHLRNKLNIPKEKFHVYLEDVGNTVSSTIPITLKAMQTNNIIQSGQKTMLVGFGVGYSWIATTLTF